MTKKERIAELERKVAELEARTPIVQVPSAWRCQCGRTDTHACWMVPYVTTTSGVTRSNSTSNIRILGAVS